MFVRSLLSMKSSQAGNAVPPALEVSSPCCFQDNYLSLPFNQPSWFEAPAIRLYQLLPLFMLAFSSFPVTLPHSLKILATVSFPKPLLLQFSKISKSIHKINLTSRLLSLFTSLSIIFFLKPISATQFCSPSLKLCINYNNICSFRCHSLTMYFFITPHLLLLHSILKNFLSPFELPVYRPSYHFFTVHWSPHAIIVLFIQLNSMVSH